MERVFIDRDYAIAYVVMAIDSIWNSANKERSIEDFIEEIKTMTEVYTDETVLLKLKEDMEINFLTKSLYQGEGV